MIMLNLQLANVVCCVVGRADDMFHGIFVYQGYCDGDFCSDFMFGLIQLVCAPTPRLSYVCNAYSVIRTYEHNVSGDPVPIGYCRLPASGTIFSLIFVLVLTFDASSSHRLDP
jgi:hypothetical protein